MTINSIKRYKGVMSSVVLQKLKYLKKIALALMWVMILSEDMGLIFHVAPQVIED